MTDRGAERQMTWAERLAELRALRLRDAGRALDRLTDDMAETLDACEAERDFLVARYLCDRWERDTGVSSDAMVREAFTGEPATEYPRDAGDLGRCERAYQRAPNHIAERMVGRLRQFRDALRGDS